MNLLRVVAHTDWGADSMTLLRLYRSLVRSKLDYGCIVYGSAKDSYEESLDRVQNAALRVCLGAFRTTPISSPHVEANELPLKLRKQKLALQYIIKLKANPSNAAYSSVYQPNYTVLFDAKPNTIPSLGIRLRQAVAESGINLSSIALHALITTLAATITSFRLYFLQYGYEIGHISWSVSIRISRTNFWKIWGLHKNCTDGSKQKSAAAAVIVNKVLVKRLPDHASILSAEAQAILLALALNIISQSSNQQFLILSDSLSCVEAIKKTEIYITRW
jgi:hypothetical protein